MNPVIHSPDPISRKPADIGALRQFYLEGLLNPEAFHAAVALVRPAEAWFSWARRMLLFFGAALVLAGIIFFFAYNWREMGRFYKLGVIQGAILLCVGAAQWKGLSDTSGKVFVLSAAVLTGVLLAVYGQIYQTGADAYELFGGWALLIAGWVIIARFSALWAVWFAIVTTGFILYWHQVGKPLYEIPYESLCLLLGVIHGAALALFEAGTGWSFRPFGDRWMRWILAPAVLIPLTLPVLGMIIDFGDAGGPSALAAIVWTGAVAGGYRWYRQHSPDMIPLALIVMNGCVVGVTLIGKGLFEMAGLDDAGAFLVLSLIILGVVSLAAVWLKKTAAAMAVRPGGPEA
jgi:uncharacterized membrane protein